ncbi:hypothetical protein Vadar_003629 [Vaccinium darrowii]|uniref:Uncharacterized protein n=1 Tax=Vaccinium darrowii TaxID=229202 RepID=A0ACB7ZJA7_9ERIC|nr:hypothetical protein Vadar_003629 [Vaccinium darrowii]
MAALSMTEMWTAVGSTIASFMFISTIVRQYCPYEVRHFFEKSMRRLMKFFYPYIHVSIHEFTGTRLNRSEAYTAVEAYLSANSSKSAKRLKLEMEKDSKSIVLSLDEHEKVTDEFQGAEISWVLARTGSPQPPMGAGYHSDPERRCYQLTFHKRYRQMIAESYLEHVMRKGKEIRVKNRQRKLYTNGAANRWFLSKQSMWSDVPFEHPARFESIAMEPEKKQEIIDDLLTFSQSQRKKKTEKETEDKNEHGKKETNSKEPKEESISKVTLSGLLNFIDGLWSAIGGERIIVFTTNYVEKLDPALIRRGRMDKHIELSYCNFEGFKVLAKNYLLVEAHPLFEKIERLLEETKITPADVAEALMPKSFREDTEKCLSNVIQAIQEAKEKAATKKADEESRVEEPAKDDSKDDSLVQDKQETEEPK